MELSKIKSMPAVRNENTIRFRDKGLGAYKSRSPDRRTFP